MIQITKTHKGITAPIAYDPSWIIKLAELQINDHPELIAALRNCTTVVGFCSCGCGDPYFIDPNSKGWDFSENIVLEREDGVDIVLDVMKNGYIGQIEIGEWDKKH